MLALLLSIRPIFADQILKGTKKFELRRGHIRILPRTRIILYSSHPVKAIVGEFRAGRVFVGSLGAIWNHLRRIEDSGISELDWPYVKGSRIITAIEVVAPLRYKTPLTLNLIRSYIPNFRPPQSYKWLRKNDPLLKLIDSFSHSTR
ncbi:MAG: DNA-binding protein [Thermoprotei archaeon]|nr:MAG: DNA-binding protein [Thermoprotei archaeon]RLF25133.1 MAG: DNA-binding protein [Thermoprotei archaeon]